MLIVTTQNKQRHVLGDSLNDKVYLGEGPSDDGEAISGHWEYGSQSLSGTEKKTHVEELQSYLSKTTTSVGLTTSVGISQNDFAGSEVIRWRGADLHIKRRGTR